MVLAVERAITLDGVGTVAAEQNLLLTDTGTELLTAGPAGDGRDLPARRTRDRQQAHRHPWLVWRGGGCRRRDRGRDDLGLFS